MAFTCDQKEYKMIPLWGLRFDERVADMVEQQGHIFPPTLLSNIYDAGAYKLDQSRLDRILTGYKSGLPAIIVEKCLGDKFLLLNGRHRTCATILNGGVTIPAIEIVTPSLELEPMKDLDMGLEIVQEWKVDSPGKKVVIGFDIFYDHVCGTYDDEMLCMESQFGIQTLGSSE